MKNSIETKCVKAIDALGFKQSTDKMDRRFWYFLPTKKLKNQPHHFELRESHPRWALTYQKGEQSNSFYFCDLQIAAIFLLGLSRLFPEKEEFEDALKEWCKEGFHRYKEDIEGCLANESLDRMYRS